MKFKILFLILTILSIVLIGCSKAGNEKVTVSPSWVSKGVVKWNKEIYVAGSELVEKVEKQIGTIKHFSMEESEEAPDNFSNEFPSGTRLFKISNIDTKNAIAVEIREGYYVKAESIKVIFDKSN